MTESEVKEIVNGIFIEEFEIPASKITPDAEIFATLGLDSLDIVDLVVALEKAFGVKIKSRESLQQIRTVDDIHRFILSHKETLGGKTS
jgi:acyl carrier protein